MTNRLSKVLGTIVNQSQAAFIPGQQIHGHIMLAYELIRGYNRKNSTPRCLLQMDIQKAYDTVNWRALEDILKELGFDRQFVNWIMHAVTTVSYKFNISGTLSKFLIARRGLRQRDPLSPYLFVIVMEYLHRSLQKLKDIPHFNFHAKCERLNLIHLCFVDDLLIFSRGSHFCAAYHGCLWSILVFHRAKGQPLQMQPLFWWSG